MRGAVAVEQAAAWMAPPAHYRAGDNNMDTMDHEGTHWGEWYNPARLDPLRHKCHGTDWETLFLHMHSFLWEKSLPDHAQSHGDM
jgi:hypothetical protein